MGEHTRTRISLWGLIELKLEILIQVSPLFILGALWPGLTAHGALAGLLAGPLLSTGWILGRDGKLWGWHAGVIGVAANLTIAVLVSALQDRRPASVISR